MAHSYSSKIITNDSVVEIYEGAYVCGFTIQNATRGLKATGIYRYRSIGQAAVTGMLLVPAEPENNRPHSSSDLSLSPEEALDQIHPCAESSILTIISPYPKVTEQTKRR